MRNISIELPAKFVASDSNDILVVPTSRLAQELRYASDYSRLKSGAKVWKQPLIQSWDQWLISTYAELGFTHPELTQRVVVAQEAFMFIAQMQAPNEEVEMHSRAITEAWQLAWDWHLFTEWEGIRETDNGRLCDDWFTRIRRFLETNDRITVSEIPQVIQRAIERQDWVPRSIIAYGFEEPTRVQQSLFSLFEEKGIGLNLEIQTTTQSETQSILNFESDTKERTSIAMWCREQLSNLGDSATIGVVINDLTSSRSKILRQFESTFPELESVAKLVSIDAGESFQQTRLYADFTTLLNWTVGEVAHTQLLDLARTPYFPNLKLYKTTQGFFRDQMTIRYYSRRLSGEDGQVLTRLVKLLPRSANQTMSFADAMTKLQQILETCGFGKNTDDPFVNAREDAIKTLDDALTRVAHLGNLRPQISWFDFVQAIVLFIQEQSIGGADISAPIQVMSRSASEHLQFDSLWVTGVSDTEWPALARPHPFIPVAMQKRAHVSNITQQDALQKARQLTANWFTLSKECVFSFYDEADQVKSNVSQLIREHTDEEIAGIDDIIENTELIQHAHPWANHDVHEAVHEFQQTNGSKAVLSDNKGRTTMLKNQAECPYRAWAIHRLNLPGEDSVKTNFPNALDRGTMIHDAIERILKEHPNSGSLSRLSEDELQKFVAEALKLVRMPKRLEKHEQTRIHDYLNAWLEEELEREEFEVIAIEKKTEVEIEGIRFEPRIDRIDKTKDYDCFVIDNKTGKTVPSPKSWNPDNLQDTQMPLYAVTEEACDELGYMHVTRKDGKVTANLKTTYDRSIREIKAEYDGFDGLKIAWREKLATLVRDFLAGKAEVAPVNNSVCNYCHLANNCRIFEETELTYIKEMEE